MCHTVTWPVTIAYVAVGHVTMHGVGDIVKASMMQWQPWLWNVVMKLCLHLQYKHRLLRPCLYGNMCRWKIALQQCYYTSPSLHRKNGNNHNITIINHNNHNITIINHNNHNIGPMHSLKSSYTCTYMYIHVHTCICVVSSLFSTWIYLVLLWD